MYPAAALLCEHNYSVFSYRLWDIRSSKTPMFTIAAHEGKVLCLDWSLPKVCIEHYYRIRKKKRDRKRKTIINKYINNNNNIC